MNQERVIGRWPRWPLLLLLAALLIVRPAAAQTGTPATGAPQGLAAAVDWLLTRQDDGGGFVGFTGEPDAGTTADAVVALAAARTAGIPVDAALADAMTYLAAEAQAYAGSGGGQAAKLALAAVAAGGDPHDIAGVDPLAAAVASRDDATGLYGDGVFAHALTMLALAGADEPVPMDAVTALAENRVPDGSWAFDGTTERGAGDTNTTALVIQALFAADAGLAALIDPAVFYLRSAQTETGGVAYQPAADLTPDANSTALAVQALIAANQDPAGETWRDAAGALAAFQNPSGAFRYADDQPDDNLLSTLQAIPALAGLPLPVTPAAMPAATPVAVRYQAAADLHHAGLVVAYGDGTFSYAYVPFAEESISAVELLRRSGIDLVTVSFGGLGEGVCTIADVGCGVADCRRRLCQTAARHSPFWQYFRQTGPGEWRATGQGASAAQVRDGDIDGWSWTGGDPDLPALTMPALAERAGVPARAETIMAGPAEAVVRHTAAPAAGSEGEGQPLWTYVAAAGLVGAVGVIALLGTHRRRLDTPR